MENEELKIQDQEKRLIEKMAELIVKGLATGYSSIPAEYAGEELYETNTERDESGLIKQYSYKPENINLTTLGKLKADMENPELINYYNGLKEIKDKEWELKRKAPVIGAIKKGPELKIFLDIMNAIDLPQLPAKTGVLANFRNRFAKKGKTTEAVGTIMDNVKNVINSYFENNSLLSLKGGMKNFEGLKKQIERQYQTILLAANGIYEDDYDQMNGFNEFFMRKKKLEKAQIEGEKYFEGTQDEKEMQLLEKLQEAEKRGVTREGGINAEKSLVEEMEGLQQRRQEMLKNEPERFSEINMTYLLDVNHQRVGKSESRIEAITKLYEMLSDEKVQEIIARRKQAEKGKIGEVLDTQEAPTEER